MSLFSIQTSAELSYLNSNTARIQNLSVGSIHIDTGVITSTQLSSSQSGITVITSGSPTYTLPVISSGITFTFIIGPGETSAKWITSNGEKIHGAVQNGPDTLKYNPALDNSVALGISNGTEFDATHGDTVTFKAHDMVWYIKGTASKKSFSIPSFTLTVLTDINSNGHDNNQVIKSLDNTHITSGGWDWDASVATAHSISLYNPHVIHLGNVGPDLPVETPDDGLGRSIHGKIPAFIDPLAPFYTKTSRNRTIEINNPRAIVNHNISETVSSANVPAAITTGQILTTKISSMKIVFRVGSNGSHGNNPDMFTNLKYGDLTAPENLWGECFSTGPGGGIIDSLKKPGSYDYDNGTHNNSHLEAVWSVKEPYLHNQVSYKALQNSAAYRYMRTIFSSSHSTTFPVSGWWTQGTTTLLSDLSTQIGWNTIVPASDGGFSTPDTLYNQIYGSNKNKNFINLQGKSRMSGILGWADSVTQPEINNDPTLSLWDSALSLRDQPSFRLQNNQDLVVLTNATNIYRASLDSLDTPIVFGNDDWISRTITDFPTNTTSYRLFQTSYTGGGSPANDSYTVAAIEITLTGTYDNSV